MENKTKQITDQDFVKWFHKNKETMSFILGNFQKTQRQKRGVTLEEMITTFIIGFGFFIAVFNVNLGIDYVLFILFASVFWAFSRKKEK